MTATDAPKTDAGTDRVPGAARKARRVAPARAGRAAAPSSTGRGVPVTSDGEATRVDATRLPAVPAAAQSSPRRAPPPVRVADLRGGAHLAVAAVLGATDVVESMHATIARGAWPVGRGGRERTSGITGFVYRAVRGTTRLVGTGLDAGLALLAGEHVEGPASPRREAVVAAVNGLWGDRLAATGNPLSTPMTLRLDGVPIDPADPRPALAEGDGRRLLLMVHGLCMNDLQWRRNGHDHGEALAREGGWTPLRLRYSSGRAVADNGRALARLLETVLARWPVEVESLAIVGHSMGGLVARSACHAAQAAGHRWPASLSALVFLGTPHHGAPLERGGHAIDRLLAVSPYAAPLARIGLTRSAGIQDLRHGRVREDEVDAGGGSTGRGPASSARAPRGRDPRGATPLPAGVPAFTVAATTALRAEGWRAARIGDGLVPLASALGDHGDPRLALGIPPSHRLVVASANHWDLLDRPEVAARLRGWLG
jgi:hypothetical protein